MAHFIPSRIVDIAASDAGSFLLVRPLTDAAQEWLDENVEAEPWQYFGDALAVEHRFGPDLLAGALADGLFVTLDGREPIDAASIN